MPQGLWRADPPPQQRPKSAPIPAQGQQPPRAATQLAAAVAIVAMAWWPATGEPRPVEPRQVRLPSAPIPAQGQAPPPVGGLQLEDVVITRAAWSETGEPRALQLLPARSATASIPTLSTPPLTTLQIATVAVIIGQWSPSTIVPQSEPSIAPSAAPAPAAAQPSAPAQAPLAVAAWPPPWIGPSPDSTSSGIAPLTLVYGDRPPLTGALAPQATLGAWAAVVSAPPARASAAFIPPVVAPAAQPAPRPLNGVGAWPAAWYGSPLLAPVAAWAGSIPVPAAQPSRPSQAGISAWPSPWYGPPVPSAVAPLTLTYGAAPTIGSARLVQERAAVVGVQWPPAWPPSRVMIPVVPLAILPPALPLAPRAISPAVVLAWRASWVHPQRLLTTAPLTLVYGQVPPIPVIGTLDFDSLATLLDFQAIAATSIDFTSLATSIDFQPIPATGIVFDSLATSLTFLEPTGAEIMGPLKFKQGEITLITFILRGADGLPIDLTNANSQVWTVRKPGQPPIINAQGLTRVAPYTSGKVTYMPAPGDVAAAGRYEAEAYVVYADGQKRCYPNGANAEVIIEPALRTLP